MSDKNRVLIIGGHTAGIGDAVYKTIRNSDAPVESEIFLPTRDEFNVLGEQKMLAYMKANGPFDQIVYSAGVTKLAWIEYITKISLDKIFEINVTGAILVAQAHLAAHPGHRVRYAVVVSDASDTPMRGSVAYCASKAALAMAVRVMARELAPDWITVAVSPGVVDDTGMTNQLAKDIPEFRNWTPEAARAYEDKGSVLGRRMTKEEVADAIVFALNGPEGLNGSTVTLNGGK